MFAILEDSPFLGRRIFGSGWQMQTWILLSLLSCLASPGVASLWSISLSSASTIPASRFLVVVLKGGLSSGVSGVLEPLRSGLGERLCERDETEDEVRLLGVAALLWLPRVS